MADTVSTSTSGVPPALSIALIVVTTLVQLGPKVYKFLLELKTKRDPIKRQKERLELLRIQLELEAFRREKKLDEFEPENPPSDERQLTTSDVPPLTLGYRFLNGAFGASVPNILVATYSNQGTSSPEWFNFIIGACVVAACGGGLACIPPKKKTEPFLCFLVGISLALFLPLTQQYFHTQTKKAEPNILPSPVQSTSVG